MLKQEALVKIRENTVKDLRIHGENYNHPGPEDLVSIAGALKDNTALATLDLSRNHLGYKVNYSDYNPPVLDGIAALADALKSNKTLKNLYLGNAYLDAAHADIIAGLIRHNRSLTTLALNDNNFGDEGVSTIAAALKQNKKLKSLHLGCTHIGEPRAGAGANAMRALGSALKSNVGLRELTLTASKIGPEGATLLAAGLETHPALRTLKMRLTNLGDEGAAVIVNALNQKQNITHLDISANSITAEGAEKLAEALQKNHSLIDLDLSGNELGDKGVDAITKALVAHPMLEKLSIDCSNAVLPKMVENLKHCKSLTVLDVRDGERDIYKKITLLHQLDDIFAANGNKNIIYVATKAYEGDSGQVYLTTPLREKNLKAAKDLIHKIQEAPEELTRGDIREIQERLPAMVAVAERALKFTPKKIKDMLAVVASKALAEHVEFLLPPHRGGIKPQTRIPVVLPGAGQAYVPEKPTLDIGDFSSLDELRQPVATRKNEYPSVLGQLVREGQFDKVLQMVAGQGQRLTPEDYARRDSQHDPSIIEMLTRQGKLALAFTLEQWKGDLPGFRKVAEMIPPGEFERQVGMSAETMASQLSLVKSLEKRKRFERPDTINRSRG